MALLRMLILGLAPACILAIRKKGKTSDKVNHTTQEDGTWWWDSTEKETEVSITTPAPPAECNTVCNPPFLHLKEGYCGRCRYVENDKTTGTAECFHWEKLTPGYGWSQCCVPHECPTHKVDLCTKLKGTRGFGELTTSGRIYYKLGEEHCRGAIYANLLESLIPYDVSPVQSMNCQWVEEQCVAGVEDNRPPPSCPSAALAGQTFWLMGWSREDQQYDCYQVDVGSSISKSELNGAKRNEDCKNVFDRKWDFGEYVGHPSGNFLLMEYKERIRVGPYSRKTTLSFKEGGGYDHIMAEVSKVPNSDSEYMMEIKGPSNCFSWLDKYEEVEMTTPEPTPAPTPKQPAAGCPRGGTYTIDYKHWPSHGSCWFSDSKSVGGNRCCMHLVEDDEDSWD